MASNTASQLLVPTSSSSSSSSSTSINFSVKLNSKNYLAWKTQLIPLLHSQDLMEYIDGSNPPPSPTILNNDIPPSSIPNPAFQLWFKKDQLLLSWILSSLSEDVFPYVVGVTSSHQAWVALATTFGAVSQNRQLQLHIELQELKKNDLSVTEYLRKAKSLSDELAAAGRTLTAAEFNAIIFRNIGMEYQAIISSLNLRAEPVTFNELHSQLVSHEILFKSNSNSFLANYSYKPPILPTPSIPHSASPPPPFLSPRHSHPPILFPLLALRPIVPGVVSNVNFADSITTQPLSTDVTSLVKSAASTTTQPLCADVAINAPILPSSPFLLPHKPILVFNLLRHPLLFNLGLLTLVRQPISRPTSVYSIILNSILTMINSTSLMARD